MAGQGPLAGGQGRAGTYPAVGAPPGPRRSAAGRFFGVVLRPRTWLNLLYLSLSFPLGLFYFVFLVVMLAVGLCLVIIWVGIFILALTAGAWWAFASFERTLADGLLGTHLQPAPRPWQATTGTWPRIKAHFGALATWKDLAFLFLKFPLGVASFCVVVTLGAVSLALLAAPFYYSHVQSTGAGGAVTRGIDFAAWHVDRLWQALLLVPLGALLGFVSLHACNGLAAVWRAIARGLLEKAGEPRRPSAAEPGQPPQPHLPYQSQPPYPAQPPYPPPTQYPGWPYPAQPTSPSQPAYPPQPGQPPQHTYPPPVYPSVYPPPPWGQWPSLYGSPAAAPASPPVTGGEQPPGSAGAGEPAPAEPDTTAGERPAEPERDHVPPPEEDRP